MTVPRVEWCPERGTKRRVEGLLFLLHLPPTESDNKDSQSAGEIVYTEAFDSLESAVGRERQLKRWSRAKKDALISGDLQTLKRISQRRS